MVLLPSRRGLGRKKAVVVVGPQPLFVIMDSVFLMHLPAMRKNER